MTPDQRLAGISRNETLWNTWRRLLDHSGLMPANWITLAHFSVSSAMNLPKSEGVPASNVLPRSARRVFIFGSTSAALISRSEALQWRSADQGAT